MEKRSLVSIVSVTGTVQETVRQAMILARFEEHLEKGKPTCLKINLGWDMFIPGSVTSRWVLEGVVQTLKNYVGRLYLVESDQVLENLEIAYRKSKFQEICDQYGVQWVNMSEIESVTVEVPNAKVFHRLQIPKILLDSQVVTIPVMKTHAKTQISGAIKNQWGCISKMRHNYHLVLNDALAEINGVIRPAFAVLDATIALEGNGPKSGRPKIVDKVLASSDIVALDTIQATLMGLDASKIMHLQTCSDRCLGTNKIEQIEIAGEKESLKENLHFQAAKHNIVSRVEELCRRSVFKWLIFDTPVFHLMLFGAKIWYRIWNQRTGKKIWREILKNPRYGPEWQQAER